MTNQICKKKLKKIINLIVIFGFKLSQRNFTSGLKGENERWDFIVASRANIAYNSLVPWSICSFDIKVMGLSWPRWFHETQLNPICIFACYNNYPWTLL